MEEVKKSNAPFAMAGLCGAFLFAVMWFVAAQADGGWTFSETLVCKLAESANCTASSVFQYGTILSGLLLAYLGVGKVLHSDWLNRAGGILVVIAGFCLIIVGGFVLDKNADIHEIAYYLFMTFMAIGILLSTIGDFINGRNLSGAANAAIFVVMLGSVFSMKIEFIESWITLMTIVWMFTESAKLAIVKPE